MRFFRNSEIRRYLLLSFLVSAIFCTVGFLINARAGLLTAAACLTLTALFLAVTISRYRHIAVLSAQLDRLLHSGEPLNFSEYAEGELAVLRNEIDKTTLRLRQQADELQKEKVRLTDSIADISHQLRTPLTSILLIVSFLQKEELPADRRLTLAKELERLLRRIDWLISALLKMSKIDAGTAVFKKERVPVRSLVQRASEPLQIPMELRGQTLETAGDEDAAFTGDMAWSVEAVENILKNCMEYTPQGGSVSVCWSENAIYTELLIRDSGAGIDPDDLPHLFERFYRGKNAGDSNVGIGLALARMIVSEQNGTIKAENRREGGACFTIRFYKSVI